MNEQRMEQVVEALQHYFDRARPDDDAFNAATSKEIRERYGGELLLMGPAVIIDGLCNAVMLQTLAFRDEKAADKELQMLGLNLVLCYRSLVEAYGMGGVALLTTIGLSMSDEDTITLIAYTLASLTEDNSPLVDIALKSAVPVLRDEFNKRYGTGCKVALAYALLRLGVREPFKTFAMPHLVPREQQRSLERMLGSKDKAEQRFVEWLVLGSIIMDIASNGRAVPEWKGWKRKRWEK